MTAQSQTPPNAIVEWLISHGDAYNDKTLFYIELGDWKIEASAEVIAESILADEDDSDLVLNRKAAAIDVLSHMGQQAKPALATLIDLLPLVESDRDSKRWLALRAARAVWKITGDSLPAADVAGKLAEDEEAWLRIHAAELLGEIG